MQNPKENASLVHEAVTRDVQRAIDTLFTDLEKQLKQRYQQQERAQIKYCIKTGQPGQIPASKEEILINLSPGNNQALDVSWLDPGPIEDSMVPQGNKRHTVCILLRDLGLPKTFNIETAANTLDLERIQTSCVRECSREKHTLFYTHEQIYFEAWHNIHDLKQSIQGKLRNNTFTLDDLKHMKEHSERILKEPGFTQVISTPYLKTYLWFAYVMPRGYETPPLLLLLSSPVIIMCMVLESLYNALQQLIMNTTPPTRISKEVTGFLDEIRRVGGTDQATNTPVTTTAQWGEPSAPPIAEATIIHDDDEHHTEKTNFRR